MRYILYIYISYRYECILSIYQLLVYLLHCILATSKIISGRILTWDSVHSWWLYSGPSLGNQTASTMTHSVTLSWHWANQFLLYPDNGKCLARKQQVSILKSLVWLHPDSNPRGSNSPISQDWRWTVIPSGANIYVTYAHNVWKRHTLYIYVYI